MTLTTIQQGYFTSNGLNTTIALESGIDWIEVYNLTQAAANQTTAVGVKYYWQTGAFANGSKWTTFKSNAADAANLEEYITSAGFYYVNTALSPVGALNTTITAISNASIPVATNTGTNGLVAGSIVRLFSVAGGNQLSGMDFTVEINTLSTTTFSLDYMTQIVAATTANWAVIAYDPLFYPTHRYITNITQAAQAVVTLSVTHGYQVGQSVRFNVSSPYGMVQMNGLLGDIVAINTTNNTITVDINTTGFTAFAFPTSAAVSHGFTQASVTPVGMDTSLALADNVNILSDATTNTGYVGITLTGGVNCPGGANSDVISWRAGSSFNNNVQPIA